MLKVFRRMRLDLQKEKRHLVEQRVYRQEHQMAEATGVLERQLTVGLYYSPITWNNIRMTFA
jgi:hypothetical protein